MRATIDKAGRLVIPKPLRDQLGLGPGEVEVVADGTALRVEALAGEDVQERGSRWECASSCSSSSVCLSEPRRSSHYTGRAVTCTILSWNG